MERSIFCIGSTASGQSGALPDLGSRLRSVTRTGCAFRDTQGRLSGNICLLVAWNRLVLALTFVTDETHTLSTDQEERSKPCQRKVAVSFLGGEADMLCA